MAVLAALLMFIFACANYLLHRDMLYPGFLQAALWCLVVALFIVSERTFVPVSDSVFVLLTAGVVLFSMGAFLGSYRHKPHLKRNYLLEATLPSKRAFVGLAVITLAGLVMYIGRAVDLASSGPTSNWFINLRYAVSVNEEESGGF